MLCRACGSDNPVGNKFCGGCGTALTTFCPRCSSENPPNKKFCGDCGASLTVLPEERPRGDTAQRETARSAKQSQQADSDQTVASSPTIPDGERRQLTVMFCDLVGSTALSAQLDPEDLRDIMRTYHQSCARSISRFDGYLAKYLGDGLLVY